MPEQYSANGTGQRPKWVPILGQWDFNSSTVEFLGKGPPATSQNETFALGLAISNVPLQNGTCRIHISFTSPFGSENQAAGVVLGFRSPEQHYIFGQLGAARSAFAIGECVSGSTLRPLRTTGDLQNLKPENSYSLEMRISGQEIRMLVDEVPVLEHLLARPLEGRQVGLIAAANHRIRFSDFEVQRSKPKAFVVMQFAEPYDTLYKEVIEPRAKERFDVIRIDQRPGPGLIIQDIQREIEQAEIVIAEVTPANPNVFYEVGYAHALGKPTILLARRGDQDQLPFDIQPFRVVFYNDTIGGKGEVERNLRMHLDAIAER